MAGIKAPRSGRLMSRKGERGAMGWNGMEWDGMEWNGMEWNRKRLEW